MQRSASTGHLRDPAQRDRRRERRGQSRLQPPHPGRGRRARLLGRLVRAAPGAHRRRSRSSCGSGPSQGHRDPDDPEVWALAVSDFRSSVGTPPSSVCWSRWRCTRTPTSAAPTSAVRLVTDIGHGQRRAEPRLGNLIRLHRPIEDWRVMAEATLPYANYWHVKNYQRDEDGPPTVTCRAGADGVGHHQLPRGRPDGASANGFQGAFCMRALRRRRAQRERHQPRLPAAAGAAEDRRLCPRRPPSVRQVVR